MAENGNGGATTAELVPVGMAPSTLAQGLMPIPNIEHAVALMDAYQRACDALLVDSDYQQIGRKRFRKRSAWRKLAGVFGVSVELVHLRYARDSDGNVLRAEATCRATAPNGRFQDGVGVCALSERGPSDRPFTKPEHDLPATAETRAKNRAIADLIAAGEVSAEEVGGGGADYGDEDTRSQGHDVGAARTARSQPASSSSQPPREPIGRAAPAQAQIDARLDSLDQPDFDRYLAELQKRNVPDPPTSAAARRVIWQILDDIAPNQATTGEGQLL
jgi:hypothetical protein